MVAPFRYGGHVLDQDEWWQDRKGRSWRVEKIPPATARRLLDEVRQRSYAIMSRYTETQREAFEAAFDMGEDVEAGWEPDSAPYFDQCMFLELEAGDDEEAMCRRAALSLAWLDSKPLIRAMEERARSFPG